MRRLRTRKLAGGFEALERRALLAVSPIDGVYSIDGAPTEYRFTVVGEDSIRISNRDGVAAIVAPVEGEEVSVEFLGSGDVFVLTDPDADGGDGNDLTPVLAHSKVKGKEGDDILVGNNEENHLDGDDGDDILFGNKGDDKLHGGDGDDALLGGKGEDDLKGDDGDDLLKGGAGNDKLKGGDGNDVLKGGGGNDELKGGDGNDVLRGFQGNDILEGEDDSDWLRVGRGFDSMEGGDDADYFIFGYNLLRNNDRATDRAFADGEDYASEDLNNATVVMDFDGEDGDKIVLQKGLLRRSDGNDSLAEVIGNIEYQDRGGKAADDAVLTFMITEEGVTRTSEIIILDTVLTMEDFIWWAPSLKRGATDEDGNGIFSNLGDAEAYARLVAMDQAFKRIN